MAKMLTNRFNLKNISDYLRLPIAGYPNRSPYRKSIYVLEGVLISVMAYLWLEYTQMQGVFKSIYPVIIAVIVIFSQYLLVEWGARLIYSRWRPFTVSIGRFWIISFSGVLFGYIMVFFNAQCPGIKVLYPDIFYFFTEHPAPVPSRLAVFYKILLIPWAISTFLITQGALKKQLTKELASIKDINDALQKKKLKIQPEKIPMSEDEKPSSIDEKKRTGCFQFQSKDGAIKIAFPDIYFIAVEDHYCNLVFNKKGEIHREYVRLTLKEALAKLPSNHFVQVHRSYAVNLQHVKLVRKEGQAYKLLIEGNDDFLPASRHRAHTFLPRLKEMLS